MKGSVSAFGFKKHLDLADVDIALNDIEAMVQNQRVENVKRVSAQA